MGLLDYLFGETVTTHEVEAKGRLTGVPLWAETLRRGMWVVKDGAVGILQHVTEDGIATLMLVKDNGTNLLETHARVAALRRATYSEIPAPRRPTPAVAAALGYED